MGKVTDFLSAPFRKKAETNKKLSLASAGSASGVVDAGETKAGKWTFGTPYHSSVGSPKDTQVGDPFRKEYEKTYRKPSYWNRMKRLFYPETSETGQYGQSQELSDHMYGKPIEEVDPFVFQDTFCTVSNKFNKHYVFRFTAHKSLYFFGPLNPLRRLCIYLSTNQLFDIFIIFVILANCVTLGLDNNELLLCPNNASELYREEYYPCTEKDLGDYIAQESGMPSIVEWGFLILYTFEFTIKVVAKGFILNKFSYMRNGWNVFDFVVIVFGYATEIIGLLERAGGEQRNVDLDIFRTFRALRALKAVSILPGLRMMINALMNSFTQLFEVMALTFFCVCIFSLFALEVFSGRLHNVCVLNKGSRTSKILYRNPLLREIINDPNDQGVAHEYGIWILNRANWLMRDFPHDEFTPCGNESFARHCPEDYTCLPNLKEDPDYGWTSFDNFFESMLSTFQLVTLDYWERLYELVMSTTGPLCIPFFIIVVFLGSFYLLNLMLAVVTMSYEAEASSWGQSLTDEEATVKPRTNHQKLTLHRTDSTFSFDDPYHLNLIPLTKYRRRTPAEREILARGLQHVESDKIKLKVGFPEAVAAQTMNHELVILLERKLVVAKEIDPEPEKDEDLRETSSTEFEWNDYASGVIPPELVETDEGEEDEGSQNEEFAPHDDDPAVPDPSSESLPLDKVPPPSSLAFHEVAHESVNPRKTTVSRAQHRQRKRTHMPAAKRYFHKGQMKTVMIINHRFFEWFMTTSIVLNTLLLASEHHHQPAWLGTLLSQGTNAFTVVFTIECVLKILALRAEYFRVAWNLFDLTLVVLSFADMLIELVTPTPGFRVFRLLRIFKLAQSWPTMKILLSIIFSTFSALGNLILVLSIVVYIFAVLGMQVIGKQYIPRNFQALELYDEDFPRWSFTNFWYAFMMVFRVLCGEWIEPLWDCLFCHAHVKEEYKCFVIFLPILIIGNFIVMNLFLALLLNSFSTEELKNQREKELDASNRADNLKKIVDLLLTMQDSKSAREEESAEANQTELQLDSMESGNYAMRRRGKFRKTTLSLIVRSRKEVAKKAIAKMEENEWRREAGKDLTPVETTPNKKKKARFAKSVAVKRKKSKLGTMLERPSIFSISTAKGFEDEEKPATIGPCLPNYCTTDRVQCCQFWEKARNFALTVITYPAFEWVVMILIIASSVLLCFEDIYIYKRKRLMHILFIANAVITVLFVIEMIFKWMALGLRQYFTTFWTVLDFSVVLVSVITLIIEITHSPEELEQGSHGAGVGALRALRTLRALRPLRATSRWQGMKVVVNALVYAIPSIFNVLLVCLLFWLVFAIMGVNLFKGRFYKCIYSLNGTTVPFTLVPNKETCCKYSSKSVYHDGAMAWINVVPNFDNVFQAYLSLFQVATFEGWMEIIAATTDITNIDEQPIRHNSYGYNGFYVVFILFGAFFTLNLFIGVIIDNFNMLKKKYEGNLLEVLLTPMQRRYYTAMKKLGRKKPQKVIRRPKNGLLAFFYDISMSRKFEIIIFAIIFSNMVVLAFERHNQRDIYTDILEGLNAYFTVIYIIEAIIKIAGLRHYYFTILWNTFDFVLVIASTADLFISDSNFDFPFPPSLLRVVRVFRIGRILRLIKAARGIRKLVFALIVSLPALFNIGALLALVSFIYAILGMALFGHAEHLNSIDDVYSFETFYKTSLMLIRLLTAAGWNDVLDSVLDVPVECGEYSKFRTCGGPGQHSCINESFSVGYMVSYIFITYLIIINMYIAVILENYVEANRDEEVGIVEDDLEAFYNHWSRYDPGATQFIGFEVLSDFLATLDPPFDIRKPNIVAIVSFNLPIAHGNKIHCLDVLYALVKHVLGEVEDSEEFSKVQEQMEKQFRKQFPQRKLVDIVSSTRVWKLQHNAAVVIQRAWRAYKERERRQKIINRKSVQGIRHKVVPTKANRLFQNVGDERKRKRSSGGVSGLPDFVQK